MKLRKTLAQIFILAVFSVVFQTSIASAATTVTDFVPNNSVEDVSAIDGTLPEQWVHSGWGTNTPIYQYSTDGRDGSRSVKITMTNYVSGDAEWDYTPQALNRGQDYRFTVWYKTDTLPRVVAHYIKDDGSEDFFGLPDPEPTNTDWQQYSDVFTVPADVKAVSVYMFLSSNGTLQTDDYHITPYKYVGFNRGLLTFTFDDGFEQNITTALPVLNQYGFKTTQCVSTQYVEGVPAQITNMQTFTSGGHEICSHSVTHPFLTQTSTAQVDYELSHAQSFLQSITGQSITDFSSPFGDYNVAVNTEIQKYYKSHRTTDEGFNSKDNLNPYRLRVQNMQNSTTLAQFQSWVNKAKTDQTWLILLYHVVGSQTPEQFDTNQADFNAQMQWLASSGLAVKRWDQALAEVLGEVTPSSPQYTLSLKPGWNLVTLPAQPVDNNNQPISYTAETFGKLVGADVVSGWSSANQQYASHVVGVPLNNFSLTNGVGFFVHVTSTANFSTLGVPFVQSTSTISVGWNMLGWNNSSSTSVEVFGSSISGADVISKFDNSSQQWVSHIIGLPLNSFTINQGDGIFVHKK